MNNSQVYGRALRNSSRPASRPANAVSWLALLCFGLALLAVPCFAQNDSLAARLPADTWLYLHWHGTASLSGVRDSNSVLRLLRDPSVAALPGKVIAYAQSQAKKNNNATEHQFTQQDADDIVSLLENPAVFGLLNHPGAGMGATANSAGTFLIYDATGKQDLLDKVRARMASGNQAAPENIPLVIDRVSVTKVVSGENTSYEAQPGNYFVRTDSLPAMAELLPRLTAANPPAVQLAAIPSACRNMPGNSLLDFLALPGKLSVSQSLSNPNFNLPAFLKALHVDQLQAVCGNLKLESSETRMQTVILGDTSAGSILNLLGDNRQNFATMALAPSGAAYECSILDLASLYSALKTGFTAALPPDRAGLVAGIDSLLAMSWGIAPADALRLFTGEMAAIRVNPAVDPSQIVYALSIQQPDKVLGLLRKIFDKANPQEKQEGDTTYFTMNFPAGMVPGAPSTAETAAEPNSFTLAVMPTMLIAAKGQGLAREAVSRSHAAASSSPSFSSDAGFQKVRPSLPGKLDSLSYTDLAHFNWEKIARDYQKQFNEQAKAAAKNSGKPGPPPIDILSGFDWQAISRYLHFALSGGWKDSTGIYFDSFIQ
ncbi:MAG TPA: hypothetical protein VGR72_04760 [Candidatus Acidoferrales bacterium]|nr:hypothetical protein [Candidatus Acidoferrales bacterium]